LLVVNDDDDTETRAKKKTPRWMMRVGDG